MTVQIGDQIPQATLMTMTPEGPAPVTTEALFKGKTVALFAVPGAFTPTCSARHLPGFVERADEFKRKGVDQIVGVSVNDAFVMGAWGEQAGVGDKVMLAADGNGEFTRALGMEQDSSKFGMGTRSKRYSMLVKDGVVEQLNLEQPGEFRVSAADYMVERL